MSTDWAGVYRATFPELVRYLYRKVWDRDRAEELAQETFVRGLAETPENPRAWLFAVAGNLARDEVRKVVRRKKHLALVAAETPERDPEPDPEAQLERREQLARAREALASLADRDREVLLLWDAGLSYGEIAEHSGLAPGAVGTTLARARRRLAEAYRGPQDGSQEAPGPERRTDHPRNNDDRNDEETHVARG